MNKLIPLACVALLGGAGSQALAGGAGQAGAPAQEGAQADTASSERAVQAQRRPQVRAGTQAAPAASATTQQVTVTGTRANDTDQRRLSTASKMVFGREELDRNGDATVGDILKRLPGVTMGGAPGRRGGGVRMRGLGNGYTQMLVNGERPPPGFSLESLSPDQVERIEVMRGPVAEHSTQAIAGTINIVLREGYQQKDVQLRIADNIENGRHGGHFSITAPGKLGNLAYTLTGALMQHRRQDRNSTLDLDTLADGSVVREHRIGTESAGRTRGIHLAPRLQYKFANNDTLTFQAFVMSNRSRSGYTTHIDWLRGEVPPQYALGLGRTESESTFARGFGNWLHRMDGGAKLDVKFGGGAGKSDSDSTRSTYDEAGVAKRAYHDVNSNRSRSVNTGGKYTKPVGQGHLLALGWDLEAGHLEQTSVAEDDGTALFDDSGANLTADTRRVALFAQDEWDITRQWSVYLGLRWEGIRTTSTNQGRDVKNTTSVFSPVAHAVYRIPGREKDQVRASLTQSYRAPQLSDLIAAPTFSTDNRPTRPDRTGNPDLKPELARGIDLAYEHYLGRSGILSASAFVRNIDNLMRREIVLRQTSQGLRWVSTPSNIGNARTSGIELEAKFQLAELVEDAPNIDFRSNYSRFWSHVDGIPGPDNRLDGQARQTANVGLDYRMKALPLTVGGSYNWTPATIVRTSQAETATTGTKRQLDLYGVWRFSPDTQLRISATNLLAKDHNSGRTVFTDGLTQATETAERTNTAIGIRLELKI